MKREKLLNTFNKIDMVFLFFTTESKMFSVSGKILEDYFTFILYLTV